MLYAKGLLLGLPTWYSPHAKEHTQGCAWLISTEVTNHIKKSSRMSSLALWRHYFRNNWRFGRTPSKQYAISAEFPLSFYNPIIGSQCIYIPLSHCSSENPPRNCTCPLPLLGYCMTTIYHPFYGECPEYKSQAYNDLYSGLNIFNQELVMNSMMAWECGKKCQVMGGFSGPPR